MLALFHLFPHPTLLWGGISWNILKQIPNYLYFGMYVSLRAFFFLTYDSPLYYLTELTDSLIISPVNNFSDCQDTSLTVGLCESGSIEDPYIWLCLVSLLIFSAPHPALCCFICWRNPVNWLVPCSGLDLLLPVMLFKLLFIPSFLWTGL